jgi:hypothetical protein
VIYKLVLHRVEGQKWFRGTEQNNPLVLIPYLYIFQHGGQAYVLPCDRVKEPPIYPRHTHCTQSCSNTS